MQKPEVGPLVCANSLYRGMPPQEVFRSRIERLTFEQAGKAGLWIDGEDCHVRLVVGQAVRIDQLKVSTLVLLTAAEQPVEAAVRRQFCVASGSGAHEDSSRSVTATAFHGRTVSSGQTVDPGQHRLAFEGEQLPSRTVMPPS